MPTLPSAESKLPPIQTGSPILGVRQKAGHQFLRVVRADIRPKTPNRTIGQLALYGKFARYPKQRQRSLFWQRKHEIQFTLGQRVDSADVCVPFRRHPVDHVCYHFRHRIYHLSTFTRTRLTSPPRFGQLHNLPAKAVAENSQRLQRKSCTALWRSCHGIFGGSPDYPRFASHPRDCGRGSAARPRWVVRLRLWVTPNTSRFSGAPTIVPMRW